MPGGVITDCELCFDQEDGTPNCDLPPDCRCGCHPENG
jgi:hypothetical protein